jgi:hypothetical protein
MAKEVTVGRRTNGLHLREPLGFGNTTPAAIGEGALTRTMHERVGNGRKTHEQGYLPDAIGAL